MDFAILRNSNLVDDQFFNCQDENVRSSIVIRPSNLVSNYASITSESPQLPANIDSSNKSHEFT
jgi:hypothetical protein